MRTRSIALFLVGATLCAQAPHYELRGTFGVTSFVDDSSQNHSTFAPSVRYYFLPKLAAELEFQYLHLNRFHHDRVLLPSIVWDIRRGRIVPYLSGGAGIGRTYNSFQASRGFISTEVFAQGGGGVKIYLDDHWYIAPEFKVGWELHARISGTIGYTWRRP
jgi:hypothetical protein